jgi:hypothetical protein
MFAAVGCQSDQDISAFCARFFANTTNKEENFDFAEKQKILPVAPHRKRVEPSEISGRSHFLDSECGVAYFRNTGRYEYQPCLPDNYQLDTEYNINKFCDYLKAKS